jgi:hypothetical protein
VGARETGLFQDAVLEELDLDVIEAEVPFVVDKNYDYKANTASDPVGVYMYTHATDRKILRRLAPGDVESGDYVLERAGLCEILITGLQFTNYYWHESGQTIGLSDAEWQALLPMIESWYSPGGPCENSVLSPATYPGSIPYFPLMLRTRRSDWSVQNVETLLPISVAIHKAQEPPPTLGKGSGPSDCTSAAGDTQFACPDAGHYAFASAHAYSESVSGFYNRQLAGISTPYPIPFVPYVMDWEPRLFPFEPYPDGAESPYGGWVAYEDIASQIEADGVSGAYAYLSNRVFTRGGRSYFLY